MCYTPFDKGESSPFLGTVDILFNESYAKRRDFQDGVEPPRAEVRACTPKCVTARRRGSSTCFVGPAFAEAASRRQAEPSEAYPTTLV